MSNCRKEISKISAVILHSKDLTEKDSSCQELTETGIVQQAHNDEQVISLWLHGRSVHTQKAYSSDIVRFLKFVNKQLRVITLGDLQSFADNLKEQDLKPASQNRILAAVKSLITFGFKIGYLKFDISKPLRVSKFRDELSERIMTEAEVQRIIGMENHPRNKLLLRVLYAGGIRVSSLCGLCWKDIQEREKTLTSKETELKELKAAVEKFPEEMNKTRVETENRVKKEIEISYKHKADLASKEIEGERKLAKQVIASLESKIKEQAELIAQLSQKADEEGEKAQQIAVKAIEGASMQHIPRVEYEKKNTAD